MSKVPFMMKGPSVSSTYLRVWRMGAAGVRRLGVQGVLRKVHERCCCLRSLGRPHEFPALALSAAQSAGSAMPLFFPSMNACAAAAEAMRPLSRQLVRAALHGKEYVRACELEGRR